MMRHFPALLTVVFLCTTAAMAERPRLAIVASPGTNDAAALLTATLAGVEAFDLVERARLDAVAGELELELAGLTTQDALRLGRLLRANGLLHVTSGAIPDTKRVIWHLQLMAVEPGVVVWSMAMPSDADVDQWPQLVAERLVQASAKLQVAREAAVAVSVMGLHVEAPQPGTGGDARALRTVLIHRLVASPHLFVLERNRLDLLVHERAIGAGEVEPFWTGRYVLDGVLRPSNEPTEGEPWIAALSLRPPGDGAVHTFEVPGDPADPVAWADRMGRAVVHALSERKVAADEPTSLWDAKAEAQRLIREGMWAEHAGADAMTLLGLAESAAALGEDSPELTALRIRARCRLLFPDYAEIALYPERHDFTVALEDRLDARIARGGAGEAVWLLQQMQTMLDLWLSEYERLSFEQGGVGRRGGITTLGAFLLYLNERPDYPAPASQIDHLRRTLLETAHTAIQMFQEAPESYYRQSPMYITDIAWYLPVLCETPQQAVDAQVKLAEVVVAVPVIEARDSTYCAIAGIMTRSGQHLPTSLLPRWTRPTAETLVEHEEQLLRRLTTHDDPRVKLIGVRLSHRFRPMRTPMAAIHEQFWAMRDLFAQGTISYHTYSELIRGYGSHHKSFSFTPPDAVSSGEMSRRIIIIVLQNREYMHHVPLNNAFNDMYHIRRTMSLEKAQELDDAMGQFAAQETVRERDRLAMTVRRLRKRLREWHPQLPPLDELAGESLAVTRYWWPAVAEDGFAGDSEHTPALAERSFHRTEGELWFTAWQFGDAPRNATPQSPARIYHVNLATGASQALSGPVWTRPEGYEEKSQPPAYVLVTPRWLYHVRWPWLDRYDRRTGQWHRVEGVFGAREQPATDGKSVYLLTRSAQNRRHQTLVQIDMASNEVTTLAGTARPTPSTPLDDLNLSYEAVTVTPDGRVVVATRNHVDHALAERRFFAFAFAPAADEWNEISARAASGLVPEDFLGSGVDVRRHFHARPSDLEPFGRHWGSRGDELFLKWSNGGEERSAERVRLAFESPHWLQAGAPAHPHPAAERVIMEVQKAYLFTFYKVPEGLVILTDSAHGFWFIPHEELP